MATVKLAFKQKRESVIISSNLKYRVTTLITSIYDNDSGAAAISGFPKDNPPLFLLKKINLTASEYVKQSEFVRVAVPQDFQETDPTEYEYTSDPTVPKTWTILAATTDRSVKYDGLTPADPNLVPSPSDAKVDQNEYYISNLLVQEYDYLEDADIAAENVRLSLQIFKERINDFLNDIFSTMNDGTEYPSGWAEYDM